MYRTIRGAVLRAVAAALGKARGRKPLRAGERGADKWLIEVLVPAVVDGMSESLDERGTENEMNKTILMLETLEHARLALWARFHCALRRTLPTEDPSWIYREVSKRSAGNYRMAAKAADAVVARGASDGNDMDAMGKEADRMAKEEKK